MIIDASHKPWIILTSVAAVLAVALYVWLDARTPGGLTGGSTAGLWYGIAGSSLMIYAGLLSALRKVPAWSWIGARKTWLKGHIWLGLLSVPLIGCHSGFGLGGLLERILWLILGLVVLSGLGGLALQQWLPRLMTLRVPAESLYEQIPYICGVMRREADSNVEKLCGPLVEGGANGKQVVGADPAGQAAAAEFKSFYVTQVRPFLSERYKRTALLASVVQAESAFARLRMFPLPQPILEAVTQLEQLCEERRQLAEQERLQHWLHGWLFLHVPLSAALLVAGVAHVIASLYY